MLRDYCQATLTLGSLESNTRKLDMYIFVLSNGTTLSMKLKHVLEADESLTAFSLLSKAEKPPVTPPGEGT